MLSYDLRETLQHYVAGKLPLEALEDWLAPRLPSLCQQPDSEDCSAVAAVQLGLAEMSDGLLSEEDFRKSLAAMLREYAAVGVSWNPLPQDTTSSVDVAVWPQTSITMVPLLVWQTQ